MCLSANSFLLRSSPNISAYRSLTHYHIIIQHFHQPPQGSSHRLPHFEQQIIDLSGQPISENSQQDSSIVYCRPNYYTKLTVPKYRFTILQCQPTTSSNLGWVLKQFQQESITLKDWPMTIAYARTGSCFRSGRGWIRLVFAIALVWHLPSHMHGIVLVLE